MAQVLIRHGGRLSVVSAALLAAMLCLPFYDTAAKAADTSGTTTSETVTSGPGLSFADQVKAALAADPEGGDDLEAVLEALIATQPDGAQAAVTMMIALGSIPTPGMVDAVSRAIARAKPFTAAQLQTAVEVSVESSSDPVSATRGILSVVGLTTDYQAAVGAGLGRAVSNLSAQGKGTDAAVMAVEIDKAPAAVKQSYAATQSNGGTSGTQQTNGGGGENGNNTSPDTTPENPASAS